MKVYITRKIQSKAIKYLRENGLTVSVYKEDKPIPKNILLKNIYKFYFHVLLPRIGRVISGHQSAYGYLPASVSNFPDRMEFAEMMSQSGFTDVTYKDMTFGIVTVYAGYKNA